MKVWLMKLPNGDLRPLDEFGVKRISTGEAIEFDYKIPRNVKFHRKFFAFMNAVYGIEKIEEEFSSMNHLRKALAIAVGHFEILKGMDGQAYVVPLSISFKDMDDAAFDQFYAKVMSEILKRLPLYCEDDIHALENEVMSFA